MIDQEALKSIEDLHRLKTDGLITEEDYEKAKARLLFGPAPGARPAGAVPFLPAGPVATPAEDDHLGWITLPLRRYADFTGRSRRKEFWMFQLIFAGLAMLATAGGVDLLAGTGGLGGLALLLTWVALLGLALPFVACQVRRLQDQDRSGWLALLNLVPYVGAVALYIVMLFEGTPGDNRYGPDPKAR